MKKVLPKPPAKSAVRSPLANPSASSRLGVAFDASKTQRGADIEKAFRCMAQQYAAAGGNRRVAYFLANEAVLPAEDPRSLRR